jgi:hypothetical protein
VVFVLCRLHVSYYDTHYDIYIRCDSVVTLYFEVQHSHAPFPFTVLSYRHHHCQVKPTKPTTASTDTATATADTSAADSTIATGSTTAVDDESSSAVEPVPQPQVQEGEVVPAEPQQPEVEGYNYCSDFMQEVWSANMTVSDYICTF